MLTAGHSLLMRGEGFRANFRVPPGMLEYVAGPSVEAQPYKLGHGAAAGAPGAPCPGRGSSSTSD